MNILKENWKKILFWAVMLGAAITCTILLCNKITHKGETIAVSDDVEAIRQADGNYEVSVIETGKTTIKDISIEWVSTGGKDSLAVFSQDRKRGYFNIYTGEIVIEAQYRRAWIFSEGLAAVENHGYIGFINHAGEMVIPAKFPYRGNSLSEFVFEDGHCAVANDEGKCGVIDTTGNWIIEPLYDDICLLENYAVGSNRNGEKVMVDYHNHILHNEVMDNIYRLRYTVYEKEKNIYGDIITTETSLPTGYLAYEVCGRQGLMGSDGHRITPPIYDRIIVLEKELFRAILLDGHSEVLIDGKGKIVK